MSNCPHPLTEIVHGNSYYKPKHCWAIIAHMAQGKSARSYSLSVGIDYFLIQNDWPKRYPEFGYAYRMGQVAYLVHYEELLSGVSRHGGENGQVQAILRTLATFSPEWREKTEVQSTNLNVNVGTPDERIRSIEQKFSRVIEHAPEEDVPRVVDG